MLIILSPAKIQNFTSQNLVSEFSQPEFLEESEKIVSEIRQFSAYELSRLLNINTNLGQLNADRYFNWQKPFTIQFSFLLHHFA